jgi:hypothetical protein
VPKFTFHADAHDHDEIEVEAASVEEARDKLFDWCHTGNEPGVRVVNTNIDDGYARYWKEEVSDYNCFDEDGEQIDE